MQPNLDNRPKSEIRETSDIKPGDYIYMCSDGMLEQADMEDGTSIRNVFSKAGGPDEDKIKILRKVTENNQDNHSAIIIHITDVLNGEKDRHDVKPSDSSEKPKSSKDSSTGKSLVIRILITVALLMAVILAVVIFI